jgi:hypothetical protein
VERGVRSAQARPLYIQFAFSLISFSNISNIFCPLFDEIIIVKNQSTDSILINLKNGNKRTEDVRERLGIIMLDKYTPRF